MNRKILAVILSLALLAGGVAIGIHILHQKALAQVIYTVEIFDEELIPVNNGTVWFSFDGGIIWLETIWMGDGQYEFQLDDWAGEWLIWLEEPDIDEQQGNPPGNPIEGSATIAFQSWMVFTD